VAERRDSDREVLTSLPRTRPVRRSAKRGDRDDASNGTASATARRASAARPKTATKATNAKARPAGTAAAKPKPARRPKPKAAEQPRTAPRRKVPPAGYAAPSSRGDDGGAGTADLLSTTIQAAAELAQIGLTVGRQTLQSMIDRLPKP